LGQWFSVDLELWVDLRQAGSSDRLEATVDYGPIVQAVQTLVKASRFQLLESLAEAIASLVLEQTGIPKVRVSLTKLNPPIPDFSGQVTLVITRP
jgi:dihydroneopterin aldolase